MLRSVALRGIFIAALTCSAAADDFETIDHIPSQIQVENFESPLSATEALKARPITSLTLDLIKDFEGWRPSAYNDPVGYCTIGYGHLIALERCESIELGEFRGKKLTPDEGRKILEKDTRRARLAVQQLVRDEIDLNDDQFGALSAFVFNVGEGKFSSSTMLLLLNENLVKRVPPQFSRWVRSKGLVLAGLQNRRACERMLFEGDLSREAGGVFNRDSCQSLGATDIANTVDIDVGEK